MAMLEVKDISVYYGVIQAINGISFEVNQGEIVTLIGANGAGKTTTMQSIMGLIPIREGHVFYEGKDITKTPCHKIVEMGMTQCPEGRRIFQELSVYDNLLMGAFALKDKKNLKDDIEKIYTRFPRLEERKNQIAGTLSGGERQRISIARAFLKDAPIILLDEATASLDVENETLIQTALSRLIQNKTVLIIAHRMRTVAGADKIVVLSDGVVAEQGAPDALYAQNGIYTHMVQLQTGSQNWTI